MRFLTRIAQATKALQPYLKCQVIDTGVPYYPVTFAYAMPKNSPFFEAFDYHIKHLKEIGAVKRYHDMDITSIYQLHIDIIFIFIWVHVFLHIF